MDNTYLEELIKEEITSQMQEKFFEIFSQSQLLMPVDFSDNLIESAVNSEAGDVVENDEHIGFNINYLEDTDGNRAVPLFTSDEVMEKSGLRSSVMAIFMSDLADMLKQTDKYSVIAVNPFTDYDINIPVEAFIGLFDESHKMLEVMSEILQMLKEKSVELEEDYVFYARGEDDFMMDGAVDDVFVPNIPFNISTSKEFHDDFKYLNVLLMPASTKILYIGNVVDDAHYDTIVAPGSEFELVEEIDEYTRVWKCGNQPFYDS